MNIWDVIEARAKGEFNDTHPLWASDVVPKLEAKLKEIKAEPDLIEHMIEMLDSYVPPPGVEDDEDEEDGPRTDEPVDPSSLDDDQPF